MFQRAMWLVCAVVASVALAQDTAKLQGEMVGVELADDARRELVVKRNKEGLGILQMGSDAAASSDHPLSPDRCDEMKTEKRCKNIPGGGCKWLKAHGWGIKIKSKSTLTPPYY